MGDALVFTAIRSRAVSVNLSNKRLEDLPESLALLSGTLEKLNAKNNSIRCLFPQFSALRNLTTLHLGNNCFSQFPDELGTLERLEVLHMHNNSIQYIPESCIGRMSQLRVLNLASNRLQALPVNIGNLENLRLLSVEKNQLKSFPDEIATCTQLEQLNANENEIQYLPIGFGYLISLQKCWLRKNFLQDLPETFGRLVNLRLLDLAGNDIRIFPTKFHTLEIPELYLEKNQLILEKPVKSVQEDEVMSLKELTSRACLSELDQPNSLLRRTIRHYPALREMLSLASRCALCDTLFLNTWLECVHFVDSRSVLKSQTSAGTRVPVRALLCSYRCFNSQQDQKGDNNIVYYGVAFPASPPPSAN